MLVAGFGAGLDLSFWAPTGAATRNNANRHENRFPMYFFANWREFIATSRFNRVKLIFVISPVKT